MKWGSELMEPWNVQLLEEQQRGPFGWSRVGGREREEGREKGSKACWAGPAGLGEVRDVEQFIF